MWLKMLMILTMMTQMIEEVKKMSTAELLELISEQDDEESENDAPEQKQKRHIVDKLNKLLGKGKKSKEVCEDIQHGEHCEKAPVENCHDVEKCRTEPRRQCKQV